MSQFFTIHTENPQIRLIRQVVSVINAGGVIVYPTDSCYALGCQIGNKDAMQRIRAIREVDDRHHFTLVCRDLAEISRYAKVDNTQYRLLKANTPGSYTFILQATKEVPKRLQHPKRNTIGLRVPDHSVVQALLTELDEPLLSSTLMLPGDEFPHTDPEEIRDRIGNRVDMILDAGSCGIDMTTVIDLTDEVPALIRAGKGPIEPFGLSD
ncbi:L-threonylcarbamoyladenylate synthase [Sulfurirhabdus autotrophica]|uniref:tRNA threonylcarbamoyl adenosine modification protein (Sua5/YciO/YrdC/YwlC family) n=1 Tax=Sulfurirhabdus autotrophica TaxID=1706046 RepID=A0A4R3YDN7_9PROT|nr:L-threonylcarbamoyladenylate synthase [Sulfurirhabdus autotrophica]TCV90130.1 tRNA threonylcarbamoyl adenosine modification protein (Sua5/YciO/YrdC/YwlC family) [Sulfurirhabdus autotrophica]